jgi:uncharacterized protein
MRSAKRLAAIAALLLAAAPSAGCVSFLDRPSTPINSYVLSASSRDAVSAGGGGGPIYAVAPVRVPEYLQQRSIVTRTGENEIDLAANDQWGAPLADGIGSVLAENLAAALPSERVVHQPVTPALPIDTLVFVEIVRFERQTDGAVDLLARWSVFGAGGRTLLTMRTSSLRAPDVPNDYPAITAAMSALLGDLARDIAADLRRMPTPTMPPLS